jgi:hypothetical protein
MLGVLVLRRMEHPGVSSFLDDEDNLVRLEAIRALYDTSAVDSTAGARLIELEYQNLPVYIQARLVVAAARWGNEAGFDSGFKDGD